MIIEVKTPKQCPLRSPASNPGGEKFICNVFIKTGNLVCEGENLPKMCPLHSRLIIVEKEGVHGSPETTPR